MSNPNNAIVPQLYRIRERRQENDDTFTVELTSIGGDGRIPFEAGQFNMLYVFGLGEIPISISGDPAEPDRLVHTTRAVGVVTNRMAKLKTGDMLGVRGPFGAPWPLEEAKGKNVVLIAGGIGLAPLRPALYQLLAHRDDYEKIVLLYGARTQEDILFRTEVERWRSRFDLDIYVTVDRATGGWHGSVGVVTTLIPRAPFDPRNSFALICGPEVMMRFTVQALHKRGVPLKQTYLSMERNMKCGTGLCGHCQFGPLFVCKNGPVFRLDQVQAFLGKWEV